MMHAMAVLFAAHASLHGFRFGVSMASSFATWRTTRSQSGRLSCGSLLTNRRRQSATRHRQLVACPSAGNGDHVPRHLSACHHQVGRASFGAQRRGTALPRPTSIRQNLWKSNQGSKAMPRPSIIANAQKAYLFSPALASVPSPVSSSKCNTLYGRPYITSGVL